MCSVENTELKVKLEKVVSIHNNLLHYTKSNYANSKFKVYLNTCS